MFLTCDFCYCITINYNEKKKPLHRIKNSYIIKQFYDTTRNTEKIKIFGLGIATGRNKAKQHEPNYPLANISIPITTND